MKTIFLASMMISSLAMAQAPAALSTPIRSSAEIETSCRVKAKEIAAETYRSCVTDQKNSQIEQIKKDYQAKLQALKAHYETEIKKLSGAKAKASLDESEASESQSEKSEKKIEDNINTADAKASESTPEKPQEKPQGKQQAPVKKTPAKKALKTPGGGNKIANTTAKPKGKRSGSSSVSNEMTVRLKPAPVTPPADESVMDLPEPIPVENVKADSAI